MDLFFSGYMEQLEEVHSDMRHALADLPAEALDWSPGPEMNSMVVLVVHSMGAERYWIGDVALQERSERDREAEFQSRGLDSQSLVGLIDKASAYARDGLEKLSLADLHLTRISPRNQKSFTAAWALMHALQHTALHAGQVQITRQLWEQR